jgi:hypothetical protein
MCTSVSATCIGSCSNSITRRLQFEAELALDLNHAQALAYLGDVELKRGNADKAYSLLAKRCS